MSNKQQQTFTKEFLTTPTKERFQLIEKERDLRLSESRRSYVPIPVLERDNWLANNGNMDLKHFLRWQVVAPERTEGQEREAFEQLFLSEETALDFATSLNEASAKRETRRSTLRRLLGPL